MSTVSSKNFKEILKNDGYSYVLISKNPLPLDLNFPNLPEWHEEEFEEYGNEMLPVSNDIRFEYKGSNYKLLSNVGDADSNDGSFGALFDDNNEKILDILSTGDNETTMQSLKTDDPKICDDLAAKLKPYLRYNILLNNKELEYLVFKVLVETQCLFGLAYFDDEDDE